MTSRKKRYAVALVLCGAAGAALAQAATSETRVPISRERFSTLKGGAQQEGLTCQGGPQSLASIELIPDAVINKGGRERIEYHGEVVATGSKRLGIAWKADVVNDRGDVVADNLDSGQGNKAPGEAAITRAISADLADGFYALRVRAAIAADGEPSDVVEALQYVEVRGGKWAELEQSEWLSRSRVTEGFSEAEVKAKGWL